jgi:hypothetical protein
MSYLDRTYVIFDGDADRWARVRMMDWKSSSGESFNFFQAHDLLPFVDRATPRFLKAQIWDRLAEARQVLVLVGENTRNCGFALWEIDLAQTRCLPIVVANLNDLREMDPIRCPAILRDWPALHVAFSPRIVEAALDHFPAEFAKMDSSASGARRYSAEIYRNLAPAPQGRHSKDSRIGSLAKWMMAGR